MGKPTKQHRKKKFNYNKNRRRAWKKSKKMPDISCEPIKMEWDKKKTVEQNLKEMGLSANPNVTIPIPTTKELMAGPEFERLDKYRTKGGKSTKKHVVDALESEANAPQQKRLRLSQPEVRYCTYMMEKYGEDYKAMARDSKNHYQDTPKQIRRKILTFKNIPEQYDAYLESKSGDKMEVS